VWHTVLQHLKTANLVGDGRRERDKIAEDAHSVFEEGVVLPRYQPSSCAKKKEKEQCRYFGEAILRISNHLEV